MHQQGKANKLRQIGCVEKSGFEADAQTGMFLTGMLASLAEVSGPTLFKTIAYNTKNLTETGYIFFRIKHFPGTVLAFFSFLKSERCMTGGVAGAVLVGSSRASAHAPSHLHSLLFFEGHFSTEEHCSSHGGSNQIHFELVCQFSLQIRELVLL